MDQTVGATMSDGLMPRLPRSSDVHVMYSGLNNGELVMGDATVTAVTANRLSLKGDRPVRPGMDATLLIFLPGSQEPIGIAESRVSEVGESDFHVELRSTSLVSRAALEKHIRCVMARKPRSLPSRTE